MNIICTNYNRYLSLHGGFSFEFLNRYANSHGLIINITDKTEIKNSCFKNICVIYSEEEKEEKRKRIEKFLSLLKPKSIVNLIEYYFPFELIPDVYEKIYFVRNLACHNYHISSHQKDKWKSRSSRELEYIKSSQKILVDSYTSKRLVDYYYNVNSTVVLRYINPLKFLNFPSPVDYKSYYLGRLDEIKYHKEINRFVDFIIGDYGTDKKGTAFLSFEEYFPIIKQCLWGVFPAYFESNGYAIQECLAMSRIPIVRKNSGGPEELITHGVNGFIFESINEIPDFFAIEKETLLKISKNSASTISMELFNKSEKEFKNLI